MNAKIAGTERPYTHEEFLDKIKAVAKERKLDYFDQLDYILANERRDTITMSDVSLRSDTHWGGSEGIYTNFYLWNCGKKCHIFTAKTLGESDEDYVSMHVLAANICLIAMDYIRSHDDEFNWTGYDLSYVKDEKLIPYMWCGTLEGAQANAEQLKQKGYKTTIRNNATRLNV